MSAAVPYKGSPVRLDELERAPGAPDPVRRPGLL
jgi:hypothetical protein